MQCFGYVDVGTAIINSFKLSLSFANSQIYTVNDKILMGLQFVAN